MSMAEFSELQIYIRAFSYRRAMSACKSKFNQKRSEAPKASETEFIVN